MLGFGFIYILYYIFLLTSKYVFFYSAIQCVTLFNFIKVTLKPRLFTLVFLASFTVSLTSSIQHSSSVERMAVCYSRLLFEDHPLQIVQK